MTDWPLAFAISIALWIIIFKVLWWGLSMFN